MKTVHLSLSIFLNEETSPTYLAEDGSGGVLIEGADDDSSVRVLQEVHLGLKVIPGVTEGQGRLHGDVDSLEVFVHFIHCL